MKKSKNQENITRREFFKRTSGGLLFPFLAPFISGKLIGSPSQNDLFWIKDIPDQPFLGRNNANSHIGIDSFVYLMGLHGLKFYRSQNPALLCGPNGMIGAEDVVLIKVNAQWKYRGCTNCDLIRGLVQKILDHPDTFTGEVVIFENGQGRGSLNCDNTRPYSDATVHANANDETHSFLYLVNTIFDDPRVSAYLLDPIRSTFIGKNNHETDGYRVYENVSYPCFTTEGGNRIELREGIWKGTSHSQDLKLINVPVLKHHDVGGSEITASLKHFYGVLSMRDGYSGYRHYRGLGETCGKMVVSLRTPVLNIMDAIWVSHSALRGYPAETTFRANQIAASQDPVALDYWAAKQILYPIDQNPRHHPDFVGIDRWLSDAAAIINGRGGLYDPGMGILVDQVTKKEEEIQVHSLNAPHFIRLPKEKGSNPQF